MPPSDYAKNAFIAAIDNWDESAADAAVVGLARTGGVDELFEIFCRYGARDFRDIGHKAIYVANSFRCLEVIGWQHCEPVLRSLAYALLDRSGARENPARADLPADRLKFALSLTATPTSLSFARMTSVFSKFAASFAHQMVFSKHWNNI